MFGQSHISGSVSLTDLPAKIMELQNQGLVGKILKKDEVYIYNINGLGSLPKGEPYFRFPSRSTVHGVRFRVFVQLDPTAFRDVLLFRPDPAGGYTSVDIDRDPEFEIAEPPPAILVFRDKYTSRAKQYQYFLSVPVDVVKIDFSVNIIPKLASGTGVQTVSRDGLDRLLQVNVDMSDIVPSLETVLKELWSQTLKDYIGFKKFNSATIDGLRSRITDALGEGHLGSTSTSDEKSDPGDKMIGMFKARLAKSRETLVGIRSDINKAIAELQEWKHLAASFGATMEQTFTVRLGAPANRNADPHLRRWLETCDFYLKCKPVEFGTSLEKFEQGLANLSAQVDAEITKMIKALCDAAEKVVLGDHESSRRLREAEASLDLDIRRKKSADEHDEKMRRMDLQAQVLTSLLAALATAPSITATRLIEVIREFLPLFLPPGEDKAVLSGRPTSEIGGQKADSGALPASKVSQPSDDTPV